MEARLGHFGLLSVQTPLGTHPTPLLCSSLTAGLPAALPSLSLELTVLYNSLLFAISESDGLVEGEAERISHGLIRVLEACGVSGQDLSTEELWQKVLQDVTTEELCVPLHRLGALQGAVWLAANCLGSVTGLFRLLSDPKGPEPSAHGDENELLALLKAWSVPVEEDASPLVVQSIKDLKEILWTSAAFLQGLQGLEAGNLPAALSLLQAAASGFCSKRVLAQIYTCLGRCTQQMGKPQTALQHLKQALQVDFQCVSALSQAALVYRQLGETEAELEALTLLYKALETPAQEAITINPCLLIRTELLVHSPALASLLSRSHPTEVKYLLAQRCLQAGRMAEAVEHYLDLLALLQEGPQQQVPLHGRSALPRIPEVFLEAASALEQLERHKDAIAVCEEIITRTEDLIPETLRIELNASAGGEAPGRAGSPSLGDTRGVPAAASQGAWLARSAAGNGGAVPAWALRVIRCPRAPRFLTCALVSSRPYPLYLASCLKQVNRPHDEALAKDLQDYVRTSGQDP
nr:Fanconi anemia group G protein [Pelodiscus sinensis]|eukprot:XP_025045286.1 Fanconi anemia group G protein [Pelodiscus sinensis]